MASITFYDKVTFAVLELWFNRPYGEFATSHF